MFKHEVNNKRSHDSFTGIGILPIRIEAISTFIYTFSLEIEMAKTNNLLLSKLLFAAGLLFLLAIFSVFLADSCIFLDSEDHAWQCSCHSHVRVLVSTAAACSPKEMQVTEMSNSSKRQRQTRTSKRSYLISIHLEVRQWPAQR